MAIDIHEASLEYPTINVMVAHERVIDLGLTAWAELALADDGITISTDRSALTLRGLSHREWGDMTETLPILFESACPSMGRLKGRTSEAQIVEGIDSAYARLSRVQERFNEGVRERNEARAARGEEGMESPRKILQVEFSESGIPLGERVGRHVQTLKHLLDAYNMEGMDAEIVIGGLPDYSQLKEEGLGPYLAGPEGETPGWKSGS